MKKLIITLLLCVASITTNAGDLKANFFRAFQFQSATSSNVSEWKETDILICIDLTKDKLTIFSKETQVINIVTYGASWINSKGNTEWEFSAIDFNGNRCTITYILFADKSGTHVATLAVNYSDISFRYRLKEN